VGKAQPEFRGTARFDVRGVLGTGGMGVVYRVYDRERRTEVALKTLAHVSASGIFRFKQEFRALADVAHPNLVTLHELFCEHDRWFFTMELVDGIDLLTYVCGHEVEPEPEAPASTQTTIDTLVDRRSSTEQLATMVDGPRARPRTSSQAPAVPPRRGRPLLARLREALPQLVAGVHALHQSGYLHQDIKPSNILVTPAGRVVLLDFGVAAKVGADASDESAGTPAYMAPEQATGATPTPASDWYSIGVLLFELLSGRLPFSGTPDQMLFAKMEETPRSLRTTRTDLPDDLVTLSLDLLRPATEHRPTGGEILARVGAHAHDRRRTSTASIVRDDPDLIGRDHHLAILRDAYEQSLVAGASLLVHGLSGMGKSALIRTFLDELARDGALVLAGRCYERESMPYKALDTVIDALCQHLVGLSAEELAAIVPPDATLLSTLFPVLRRVEALVGDVDPELARRPHRLRRRAFVALRRLLAAIAAQRPLVVYIDDLQWGDSDSAPLLEAIVQQPGAPSMLLLGCYRSDDAERSELLTALAGGAERIPRLAVDALAAEDALELARALCRAEGAPTAIAAAAAAESRGNPFFLHELVRFAVDLPGTAMPSLDDVIRARIDAFGDRVRHLLRVLAVAGRPIALRVARAAIEVDETEWPGLVQLVQTARLVRVSGRRGDDLIECYHDRIRETVAGALAVDEQAKLHNALALAMQSFHHRDPETIARHFEAAGDLALAVHFLLQAADQAASALAFDRAAALYRRALELRPTTSAAFDVLGVRTRLATALVHAGRGAEAADIYLESADAVDGAAMALELRRLAAEQLLRSGHVDRGLVVLDGVLREMGWSLPRSALRSIPSLLWRRLRIRLRGLAPAAASPADAARDARIDVCRSAALGLALFDPVRAATFSTRHLHLALDSGDPARIAFALGVEASYMASAKEPARGKELLARAEELATPLGQPLLHGCIGVGRAIMAYERGDFREAFEGCERTHELLRDHFTGMAWELRTLQLFSLHSLFFLGEFDQLQKRVTQHIAEAGEVGDLYAIMNFRSLAGSCMHAVVHDDPARAEAEIDEVQAQLPASGFYVQHMFLLFGRTFLDLYSGNPARAHTRLLDMLPKVRGSLLLEDRAVRTFWTFLIGGTALGTAVQEPALARRMLRVAARAAKKLERDGALPYVGMAQLLRGTAAAIRDNADVARAELEAAAASFERANMRMYAACAKRRLGQLVGGEPGQALVAESDALITREGLAVPAKVVRCLAPGYPERLELRG
jgi:serine/threonine protein kinase/tetratricopeptide (TPR) repeat protein